MQSELFILFFFNLLKKLGKNYVVRFIYYQKLSNEQLFSSSYRILRIKYTSEKLVNDGRGMYSNCKVLVSSVKWNVLVHFKSQPRGQNFQAQI